MDCMEGMKEFPDKYFDLAIVDPPYGGDCARTGGGWFSKKFDKRINTWNVAPEKEYFEELFRVSRNQIIWGGITFVYLRQGVFWYGTK